MPSATFGSPVWVSTRQLRVEALTGRQSDGGDAVGATLQTDALPSGDEGNTPESEGRRRSPGNHCWTSDDMNAVARLTIERHSGSAHEFAAARSLMFETLNEPDDAMRWQQISERIVSLQRTRP